MNFGVSSVYDWTIKEIEEPKYRQIVNYGGTRSGKSIAFLQICMVLLLTKKNLKISCWRNIRAVCRATIMEDFKDIISVDFSIMSKFVNNKQEGRFTCKTTGSTIVFEGCDSEAKVHGLKQHYAFFNEITEIKEAVYDQICQRTEIQVFADYNPSKKFWLDKYQKNKNTIYYHSTYKHNPFLSTGIIEKVISYDPGIPINVKNRTANDFMHKVYGLGIQAEAPNRVYKDFARCTSKYYLNLDYKEYFALDFGSAVPTAIVGIKYDGDGTFFIRQLLYTPSSEFGSTTSQYINRHLPMIGSDDMLICDSAKLTMITDLSNAGFMAVPARKGQGSFDRSISTVQSFNIIVTVESTEIIEENSSYEYKIDRYGLKTDDVERKQDHLLDAIRYGITYLKVYLGINI